MKNNVRTLWINNKLLTKWMTVSKNHKMLCRIKSIKIFTLSENELKLNPTVFFIIEYSKSLINWRDLYWLKMKINLKMFLLTIYSKLNKQILLWE